MTKNRELPKDKNTVPDNYTLYTENRLSTLETDVRYIKENISEIKTEQKNLNDRIQKIEIKLSIIFKFGGILIGIGTLISIVLQIYSFFKN